MNTIHSVEYVSHSKTIRVSGQMQVENAIFTENTKWFILAHSSPLFKPDILDQIE